MNAAIAPTAIAAMRIIVLRELTSSTSLLDVGGAVSPREPPMRRPCPSLRRLKEGSGLGLRGYFALRGESTKRAVFDLGGYARETTALCFPLFAGLRPEGRSGPGATQPPGRGAVSIRVGFGATQRVVRPPAPGPQPRPCP